MAPSIVESVTSSLPVGSGKATQEHATQDHPKPLKLSGALDQYKSFDLTPTIGREFPEANVVDWINAENSDELLRDLAITISQRGVVFFRKQDALTNDIQKVLIQRLGELTNKPKSSSLHIHPVLNSARDLGGKDNEVSTISSKQFKQYYKVEGSSLSNKIQDAGRDWHTDIAFEPVPADYTSLRLVQLPKTGGDTLWASGHEIYDRISTPYQKFLEGLTATYAQPFFQKVAAESDFELYSEPRGSPHNIGSDLTAVHPIVRTNPVTGWKSVFAVGGHVKHVNGLTEGESKRLLDWFKELTVRNHDLQVRFKWVNGNDLAIWDNRSNFHAATFDIQGQGERFGNRVVGIGEKPYFDPKSVSRREALAAQTSEIGEKA